MAIGQEQKEVEDSPIIAATGTATHAFDSLVPVKP